MDNQEIKLETPDTENSENKIIEEKNILNDINENIDTNLFIITKELEEKIPFYLSYIQNPKNEIINKTKIIKYLLSLINNIPYNLEIILAHKSNEEKDKKNLYEIIIDQYIFSDKKEKEYFDTLLKLINSIFTKLSYNKDVYRYILSHISNFLNKKNEKENTEENYLNETNYHQILDLIHLFYQSKKDDRPYNYFFFNGDKNTYITINNNEKNSLDFTNDLYLLFFMKLIDYQYFSKIIEKTGISKLQFIKINFKDNSNIFQINIDYKNSEITTEYNETKNEINIPYHLFDSKEINNVLIKLTKDVQLEVYIAGKNINLPKSPKKENKILIDNIQICGEIYSIFSSIMIYKDKPRNKINLIPNFLMEKQTEKKDDIKYVILSAYKDGFDEEITLTSFVKADIMDKIISKNVFDSSLANADSRNIILDEMNKFIVYNLISLYTPTRMIVQKEKKENKNEIDKKIILVDSINNLNGFFNINELYQNSEFSKYGGVRILKNILQDFTVDLNGINHLLPCIEIMINYPELLTSDNLSKFMSVILNFFTNFKYMISNEQNNNFFYLLSLFLEKTPEKRNSDLHAFIISILITLRSFESEINENKIFKIYIQDFFNNVCMNEKILFKFNHEDRALIYKNIYEFLITENSSQINIDINITNIITLLLRHEKNKYTHFCCKKHSEYFNKESEIMEPELCKSIEPIINIVKLIFNQYSMDINKYNDDNFSEIKINDFDSQKKLINLFQILTFDITPCLQLEILKLYFSFFFKRNKEYFDYLNLNNGISLITLFVFKTSLFDVKEVAFNYLIEIINKRWSKNARIEEQLSKYVTYYYYPRCTNNKDIKSFLPSVQINNVNYILSEPSENKKTILEYYDKKHYYEIMNHIFTKTKQLFINNKDNIQGYFNILLSIASKCNYEFIISLLNVVHDEYNKKGKTNFNQFKIMNNSEKFIQWLLDTCFQGYLIQNSKYNKEEFMPGFDIDDVKDEKKEEEIINQIITLSSNILLEIFINNIYKLDYLLTWAKYYYNLGEGESKFKCVRVFIFKFFLEKLINIVNKDSNQLNLNYKLYLINIIFEYISYHYVSGFEMMGKLKDFESLYMQLCPSFSYNLYSEIQKDATIKDKGKDESIYLLNERWEDYEIIKSIMDNPECLGIKEEQKLIEDKNILTHYIIDKQNLFLTDLKKYFINKNMMDYFKKSKYFYDCNKGMELIIIKYHFYTMILNIVTDFSQFKELLQNLRYLILLTIISSSTVTIVDAKNVNIKDKSGPNSELVFWPSEPEYARLQHLVKNFLYNIISFLFEKINNIQKILDEYKTKLEDPKIKSNYDNYNYIKQYLINTLLYIFQVLGTIYKNAKQKEIEKNKTGVLSGMFNKLKSFISPNKQGLNFTGGYLFIDEFLNKCIIEKTPNDINESEKVIKSTFLDDIPNFSLNSINEKDYITGNLCMNLEKIYNENIAQSQKILIYLTSDKDRYQRDLFPFVNYIRQRSFLISHLIPIYDISPYLKFNPSYLCLKPNYIQPAPNNFLSVENIDTFSEKLISLIRIYQIEQNFNWNDKIRTYRKIKKKLFSFNGIFSTRKFFYDKKNYICKYKLLEHMTEDFTKICMTPIIDMDYYLPHFSKFELKNLFRKNNQFDLIQINKLTNLKIVEEEKEGERAEIKEENAEKSNKNGLYLLSQSEFKYMNELNKDIDGTLSHYLFFKKYIENKHSIKDSYHYAIENCCYVKTAFHIRGLFYINNREIGFYSYDKLPYRVFIKKNRRNSEQETQPKIEISKEERQRIDEIQKDYDAERRSCFGSIFSPQKNKYDYLHISIPYDKLVFALKRRYYYKVSCLEIFTSDKKSFFFRFENGKLNDIISKIKHNIDNPRPEDITIEYNKFYNKIGFLNYKSQINNMNKKIYTKGYLNLKNLYEKWKKWEISSIRFLMFCNLYANRTYKDMNQYPVFPWVFTDFKSETFPQKLYEGNLRPLELPMGMLEISEEAKERKRDYISHWNISRDEDDEDEENLSDRYGSHYSTSLYVSYYLVRIFPFASIRIELQGTNFDDPNRLFNALDTSFDCSSTQKSDLRELVPELYCCPEALLNNNDFNMGEIRDNNDSTGKKFKLVQEVEAPKWCKNNAYLFIKKHREILESYEVSVGLNKWFNIIFGSKQKGSEANKIHNLFSVQSYEDYEKSFDELPLDERDISCRMLEFGVTPHQIFKSDTSQRKPELEKYIKNKIFYYTLEEWKKTKTNKIRLKLEEIKNEIKVKDKDIPTKIYYFPKDGNYDNIKKNIFDIYIMESGYLDILIRKPDKIIVNKEEDEQQIKIINEEGIGDDIYDTIPIKLVEQKFKDKIKLTKLKYSLNSELQPYVWLNYGTILVKGGYWNGNIIIQNIIKEKENNNILDNKNNTYIYTTKEYSPITKIIVDYNETIAICGNMNGTIYIYRIKPNNKLNWTLFKTINDHNSPIVSIALNETLNIAITCSENGLCNLYTLPYFKLYNSFIIGKDDNDLNDNDLLSPDIVLMSDSSLPCFIFYVNDIRTIYFYSINGKLLSKQKLNYELNEKSIKIYRDYQFVDYLVIFNSEKKLFEIRSMVEFELIGTSPTLNDIEFIDFVFSWDCEHILVLGKANDKYNLYIIYDMNNNKIIWK